MVQESAGKKVCFSYHLNSVITEEELAKAARARTNGPGPYTLYKVSQKKKPKELIRNGFNLLSLSPGDVNHSIVALVDLLWSMEALIKNSRVI